MKQVKFITLGFLLIINGFYNTINAADYQDNLEVSNDLENNVLNNIVNRLIKKHNTINIKEIVDYIYNAPIRTNQYLSKITE